MTSAGQSQGHKGTGPVAHAVSQPCAWITSKVVVVASLVARSSIPALSWIAQNGRLTALRSARSSAHQSGATLRFVRAPASPTAY